VASVQVLRHDEAGSTSRSRTALFLKGSLSTPV
jgi:hypothetical protein